MLRIIKGPSYKQQRNEINRCFKNKDIYDENIQNFSTSPVTSYFLRAARSLSSGTRCCVRNLSFKCTTGMSNMYFSANSFGHSSSLWISRTDSWNGCCRFAEGHRRQRIHCESLCCLAYLFLYSGDCFFCGRAKRAGARGKESQGDSSCRHDARYAAGRRVEAYTCRGM